MTTFEERIENMARGEYERGLGRGRTWEAAPFDTRRTYIEWAKMDIADFLDGDPVYEWADLPEDRSAGWVDLKSMRDELVEDEVLVRLEVPDE